MNQLDTALRRLLALQVPLESWWWIIVETWKTAKWFPNKSHWKYYFCLAGCSKEFIYLVLLASWISCSVCDAPLDVVEYFAGVSRICRLASSCGFTARGFELVYDDPPEGYASHSSMPHRSCFDFNGEGGFLFLVCKLLRIKNYSCFSEGSIMFH